MLKGSLFKAMRTASWSLATLKLHEHDLFFQFWLKVMAQGDSFSRNE
jgi:hypothetical protein